MYCVVKTVQELHKLMTVTSHLHKLGINFQAAHTYHRPCYEFLHIREKSNTKNTEEKKKNLGTTSENPSIKCTMSAWSLKAWHQIISPPINLTFPPPHSSPLSWAALLQPLPTSHEWLSRLEVSWNPPPWPSKRPIFDYNTIWCHVSKTTKGITVSWGQNRLSATDFGTVVCRKERVVANPPQQQKAPRDAPSHFSWLAGGQAWIIKITV